jgi:cell division septation protein DedD
MHDMGRDTKYLTLAAIVLMGIATLIVLTSTKKNAAPSVADMTKTISDVEGDDAIPGGNREPTKKDLYADESTDGASPNAVKDAYNTLAGGDSKLVDEKTTNATKPKVKVAEQNNVPSAYEERSNIKADKLTEKGGAATTAKKPKPVIEKPKTITEDTGPVYILQTSVLGNMETAQKAQTALQAKGFKSAGVFTSGKNFLVYAGKFQSRESANELKKRLDKAKIAAFVKELK